MASGSSKDTQTPTFIISNRNLQLKQDIVNIAAHKGVSYSAFLRSEIIKIRDAAPEEMKKPVPKD